MPATKTKLTRAESARLNGSKSKGPVTAQGKEKSSQNALKHGLSAGKWLSLPDDEEGAYEEFFDWMYQDLAPEGAEQIFYATRMIECMWRLRRIPTLEAKLTEPNPYKECHTGLNFKGNWTTNLNDIARYEASLERTLERNRRALKKLQNEPKGDQAALKPSGAGPTNPDKTSQNEPKAERAFEPSEHAASGDSQSSRPVSFNSSGSSLRCDKREHSKSAANEAIFKEALLRPERTANHQPPTTNFSQKEPSLAERRELDLALFYLEDHPELTLEEAKRAVSPHIPVGMMINRPAKELQASNKD